MHDDDPLLNDIRSALDEGAAGLDAATRMRLARARATALAAHPPSTGRRRVSLQRWMVTFGGAAATAALAIALLWQEPPGALPLSAPEQIVEFEMLTTADGLELIEDLDFYRWLELTHAEVH